MKVKEVLKLLKKDGWYLVRQKGSHKQFKHPDKKGLVTVSDHGKDDDLAKGTANSILKQAGLK
ncbi:MAG: type II toxin-antitoxin system HicA family toxin [Bacteroidetes bacterium]|nr:type II toxin-antitoxin system HicA family toxin [Bacteroidota bacterium]